MSEDRKKKALEERYAAFGRIADHFKAMIGGEPPADHLPSVMAETLAVFVIDDASDTGGWLLERLRRAKDAITAGAEPLSIWWVEMEAKARAASKPMKGTMDITGR